MYSNPACTYRLSPRIPVKANPKTPNPKLVSIRKLESLRKPSELRAAKTNPKLP